MADKSSERIVISTSEQERVVNLKAAFREQLDAWLLGIVHGVRYTDETARALSEALIEFGVVAFLQHKQAWTDDETADGKRAADIVRRVLAVLEAEVAS